MLPILIGTAGTCGLVGIVSYALYARARMSNNERDEAFFLRLHYISLALLFFLGVVIMFYLGEYAE